MRIGIRNVDDFREVARRFRAAAPNARASAAVALIVAALSACDRGGDRIPPGADTREGGAAPEAEAIAESLMPRLERLSGLALMGPVRVRSQSDVAVRAYVESRLAEDMPPEKLASIRDTYALLGLIPDTLDLRALLLDLYTEQVVGYYDPASKTMFVRAGADEEALRPVMAHELVHALQDQHVRVDSLIGPGQGNDRQLAAHAALEGHATIVMFAVLAEGAEGRELDPATLPNPADQLRGSLDPANSQYPVFARAPAIIRETLLFPYVGGADFVHALWTADRGAPHRAPIGDLLPQSTEQILHPETRFLAERDAPTELRFDSIDASTGWRVRHEDTFGELETSILLEASLGVPGRAFATGWDGDRFRLLENASGDRAFAWYSIWDNAAAADIFVSGMKQVALRRDGRLMTVERVAIEGRPGVRIIDVAAGAPAPGPPASGMPAPVVRIQP